MSNYRAGQFSYKLNLNYRKTSPDEGNGGMELNGSVVESVIFWVIRHRCLHT